MHTNHRRKNKFRGKHHGYNGWLGVYSLKSIKVIESRKRRARERNLMSNNKFDLLVTKVRKDILWHYW